MKIGTNRIRAPKYDMVVLSRTKYQVVREVVLGALNRRKNTMKTLKIGMIIYGWFLDIWMQM